LNVSDSALKQRVIVPRQEACSNLELLRLVFGVVEQYLAHNTHGRIEIVDELPPVIYIVGLAGRTKTAEVIRELVQA
jgi:hypothetical protein